MSICSYPWHCCSAVVYHLLAEMAVLRHIANRMDESHRDFPIPKIAIVAKKIVKCEDDY